MKKFITLCVFLLLVFSLSAQGKSIEKIDGYDWVAMSTLEKGAIIKGYLIACTMTMWMIYETSKANGLSEKGLSELSEELAIKFIYRQNVGQLVDLMDNYFASPSNRKYWVYRTIPYVAGKEWWNRNTGIVEPTN